MSLVANRYVTNKGREYFTNSGRLFIIFPPFRVDWSLIQSSVLRKSDPKESVK
jgi:hypothetical protein